MLSVNSASKVTFDQIEFVHFTLSVCVVDADLVLPTIRSAVEKQLTLIALGKANFDQVLQHTLDIFKRKFHYFVDSISGNAKHKESMYKIWFHDHI